MKLYHAFTSDKMYQIKRHGIIASILDGFIYGCNNEEDALEWIITREEARTKRKVRHLGLAIFETEIAIESFDHGGRDFSKTRVFKVQGDIHPKDLTLYTILVEDDFFTHTLEENNIEYKKPDRKLLFNIFKQSILNEIREDENGKLIVGPSLKIKEHQYEELFDFHKNHNKLQRKNPSIKYNSLPL